MRYLRWLVALPFLLLIVLFALSNRQPIELQLWPFPFSLTIPVYLLVLLTALVFLLAGALFAWIGGHGARRTARLNADRVALLEREVVYLRSQLARPATPLPARSEA